MFELLKNWYGAHIEESRVRLAQVRNRLEMEEVMSSTIEEASNLVTEKSMGGGWDRTGGTSQYCHTPSDQQSMLKQCRNAARFDPNAKAALMTAVYYIVGEGVKVNPQSKDHRIQKLWREFWDSPRNHMALRFPELVLRTFRDGEILLQYYSRDEAGQPSWKTTVRFRDVELLSQPTIGQDGTGNDASQGIRIDPNDPEKEIAFFLRKNYTSSEIESVDAKEIQHIKILSDSEQKRGESYLQASLDLFSYYKDWLKYRIILNKVRTAIVLIRKVEGGTSDDVKAIANKISESSTARTGQVKKQLPPPGTILNANSGVDYRFESANINAGDASEDGRNIKLGMAAATNMPEYVFGDASNSNYASTLIAESPFVKGIRFWQTFFEQHLKEMFRRVVQAAVDAGKLTAPTEEDIFQDPGSKQITEAVDPNVPPKPADEPSKVPANVSEPNPKGGDKESGTGSMISEAEAFFKCDVQWPEIVHRDMKATTDAIIAQVNAKLVSEPTASQMLGHDYDEEVRRQQLVEEGAEHNPFKQKTDSFGDPQMDAEVNDLMAGLSPEESDAILKSGDAGSVMKLLKKKKGIIPGVPGGKPPVALTQ
jgi:hypothetical protein